MVVTHDFEPWMVAGPSLMAGRGCNLCPKEARNVVLQARRLQGDTAAGLPPPALSPNRLFSSQSCQTHLPPPPSPARPRCFHCGSSILAAPGSKAASSPRSLDPCTRFGVGDTASSYLQLGDPAGSVFYPLGWDRIEGGGRK